MTTENIQHPGDAPQDQAETQPHVAANPGPAGTDADPLGRRHVLVWREAFGHLMRAEALTRRSAETLDSVALPSGKILRHLGDMQKALMCEFSERLSDEGASLVHPLRSPEGAVARMAGQHRSDILSLLKECQAMSDVLWSASLHSVEINGRDAETDGLSWAAAELHRRLRMIIDEFEGK